jgi:hypothetical protein
MFESFKTSFFLPENKILSFVSGILSGLCFLAVMITGKSVLLLSLSVLIFSWAFIEKKVIKKKMENICFISVWINFALQK